jgi:hypothetical protein
MYIFLHIIPTKKEYNEIVFFDVVSGMTFSKRTLVVLQVGTNIKNIQPFTQKSIDCDRHPVQPMIFDFHGFLKKQTMAVSDREDLLIALETAIGNKVGVSIRRKLFFDGI